MGEGRPRAAAAAVALLALLLLRRTEGTLGPTLPDAAPPLAADAEGVELSMDGVRGCMLVIGSSVATDTYDIMEGRRVCMVSSVGGTAGGRAGYGSVMVGGISVVVGVCVVVCGELRPTEKKRRRTTSSVCPYISGSGWPYDTYLDTIPIG